MLEGYAGAALRRPGYVREFTEMMTYNRLAALVRETAPGELAQLLVDGAALSPEAAVAFALGTTKRTSNPTSSSKARVPLDLRTYLGADNF